MTDIPGQFLDRVLHSTGHILSSSQQHTVGTEETRGKGGTGTCWRQCKYSVWSLRLCCQEALPPPLTGWGFSPGSSDEV